MNNRNTTTKMYIYKPIISLFMKTSHKEIGMEIPQPANKKIQLSSNTTKNRNGLKRTEREVEFNHPARLGLK